MRYSILLPALAVLAMAGTAYAQQAPGVSATEIKIGQTMPYSGPASVSGANGVADIAFTQSINDQGGINGRKINLTSLDDAYTPPTTVAQTRKLVESEGVAFIYRSLGTAPNLAVSQYLNDHKIPQLFIGSSSSAWNDQQKRPYSMGGSISYEMEAGIYARYALSVKPNAKIAVLYQNDDLGKDYYAGLKKALGDKGSQYIVKDVSLEITDATVSSQIVTLQSSGADVLFVFATVRPTSQAIRQAFDLGWKPLIFIINNANTVAGTLKPAGLEKSVGVVSGTYVKDPFDPAWKDDPGVKEWTAFMDKYLPKANKTDIVNVLSPTIGAMLVQTLKQAGNDLSRENIMGQARNLHHVTAPMLLPGISYNTSPTDYRPLKQLQLVRFDGERWVRFGDVVTGE
ncbi:MAG TPA: ABC transporter substrate-binding protein [Stellaceae bacterium]|nr:ABC transporter substrate-binding protein [Stellaceae bacterium]